MLKLIQELIDNQGVTPIENEGEPQAFVVTWLDYSMITPRKGPRERLAGRVGAGGLTIPVLL